MFVLVHFPRRCRDYLRLKHLILHLIVGAMLSSSVLVGCAAQSAGNSSPTPIASLYLLLNATATSAPIVVALDSHNGRVAWQHTLETPNAVMTATFKPFLQDGLVYVGGNSEVQATGTHQGVLEALDPSTGKTRWRHEAGVELEGAPTVANGVVYLGSSVLQEHAAVPSGQIESLDSQNGSVRWQKALNDIPATPLLMNGHLFVMTNQLSGFEGHILALNTTDGSVIWDYASDVPLSGGGETDLGGPTPPVIVGQHIYVQATERNVDGTANLLLLAINIGNGSVAWQYATGGISTTPASDQSGNTLCVSTFVQTGDAGTVVGLAATSGHVLWNIAVQGSASPCVAEGTTFYFDERSADGASGNALALNSQDGRQVWKNAISAPLDGYGLLPPILADGLVIPILEEGHVVVLRAIDGKQLWQHDIATTSQDVSGSQLYLSENQQGQRLLAAYDLRTGARLWDYSIGHA